MERIAKSLNETLKGTIVESLLSNLGKRLYFPLGIVSQSQAAKQRRCRIDATAGVALQDARYITHPLFDSCPSLVSSDEMVAYAPTAGVLELRKAWLNHITDENPAIIQMGHSLPVVTSGLTHAISVIGQLFIDKESDVVIFNPSWDNYHLIFDVKHQARIHNFSLFNEESGLDIDGWKKQIDHIESEKIVFLFNYPHNPTGYTPSEKEMEETTSFLIDLARKNKKILAIIDDAYFGLFHTTTCAKHSLFSYLADAHENILAVKCDAATKESLVWGFRIGFITYGGKNLQQVHYESLIEKTKGAIRSSISSASMVSQSLLLRALRSPDYSTTIHAVKDEMKNRYETAMKSIERYKDDDTLIPFPSNSGYFISFYCKKDAPTLRLALLREGIAVVSLGDNIIRIAYSAINIEDIDDLITSLYLGAKRL